MHISELAPRRVGKVTDMVNEGDEVKVKVLGIDDRGKVRLSMKVVDQATGGGHFRQARGSEGGGARRRLSLPPDAADARNAPCWRFPLAVWESGQYIGLNRSFCRVPS